MNDVLYVKQAREALEKGFSLNMPVIRVIPNTNVSDDKVDQVIDMQSGYYAYLREFSAFAPYFAKQIGILQPVQTDSIDTVVMDLRPHDVWGKMTYEKRAGVYVPTCIYLDLEDMSGQPETFMQWTAYHEASHAMASSLIEHMDVDDKTGEAILESIPDYGIRRAMEKLVLEPGDKYDVISRNVRKSSPYQRSIELGENVDRYYVSVDGRKGYRAFIQDIQLFKSARYAMNRLDECMSLAERKAA